MCKFPHQWLLPLSPSRTRPGCMGCRFRFVETHRSQNISTFFQDMKSSGLSFDDSDEVVKGSRKGKIGIFFSPNFLDILRLDLLKLIVLTIFVYRDSKHDEKNCCNFYLQGFPVQEF